MPKTLTLFAAATALMLAGPVLADDVPGGDGRFLAPVILESESGAINLGAATPGVPRSGHGHAGPHLAPPRAEWSASARTANEAR